LVFKEHLFASLVLATLLVYHLAADQVNTFFKKVFSWLLAKSASKEAAQLIYHGI
jgi:hypothetical protein